MIPQPSWPRCLSALTYKSSSCSAAIGVGLILRPSWPRCLSAYGLYDSSCSAASASADSTALVDSLLVSRRPLRFHLFDSLCFGRPHGLRDLAACQPSAYMTFLYRRLRLRPNTAAIVASPELIDCLPLRSDSTSLVASLLVSLRPLWLQLLGSLHFGRPHGHRSLTACQPSSSMAPAARQTLLLPTPRPS